MRITSVSGSADLFVARHANIFPRTVSAGAPHEVAASTSGSASPSSRTVSNVTAFLRAIGMRIDNRGIKNEESGIRNQESNSG
jgi:hypothetical protein